MSQKHTLICNIRAALNYSIVDEVENSEDDRIKVSPGRACLCLVDCKVNI